MKRLLLILLLTILPIQYSWSMAAVYCQHEESKASHFGHHAHHHQAQSQADDGSDGKPAKVHTDCEICHHAVQASLPGGAAIAPAFDAGVHQPVPLPFYHSHIAEGPKPPDWLLVA